jgi:flagellar hook-length control protein FliK
MTAPRQQAPAQAPQSIQCNRSGHRSSSTCRILHRHRPTQSPQAQHPRLDVTATDKADAQAESADTSARSLADSTAKTKTASSESSAQQTQTYATAPTQAEALASTNTDHPDARSANASTVASTGIAAGSSNASGGIHEGETDGANLPNYGFVNASAAFNCADSKLSDTASPASAVPIAGLAVAFAARAQNDSNQFDIRLDPPELGRIDARLDVDRDGQVTTHMTADRADTLELLQSQQPQLQQALEQAGLRTADDGLQFSLRDQSFTGQNNGSGWQTNGTVQLVIPDADFAPVTTTKIYTRPGTRRRRRYPRLSGNTKD